MLLSTLLTLFSAISPQAEAVDLGFGFAGGYFWTDPSENLDHTWDVMGRLSYGIIPYLALESEVGWNQGKTRTVGNRYDAITPRLNLMVIPFPDAPFRPFMVVGGGLIYKNINRNDNTWEEEANASGWGNYKNPDTDALIDTGLGFMVPFTPGIALRADGRYLLNLGSEPHGEEQQDVFSDWEVTGGFAFFPFAGRKDKDGDGIVDHLDECREEPEDHDRYQDEEGCPDPDNDADGILDVNDDCPMKAEDFDDFQDTDGCPEGDNDGDGITDSLDECPAEPEDLDGYKDEEGCPDPDNDGDGIVDLNDACPNVSEDFDGFQDTDGCLDADNDGDGILDGVDSCVLEPENYNGVDDDDGCPDENPVLERFTGVIRGINFKVAKTDILPSSYRILDEAVDVLQRFEDVNLEVQGHTDSDGSDEYNQELSEGRAKSVVDYMIGKGVDPDRLSYKGMGESMPLADNDSLEGKLMNRRVEFHVMDPDAGGESGAGRGGRGE